VTERAFTRHWAGYATAKSVYQMKTNKMTHIISLSNAKANELTTMTSKHFYAPVIETKYKICRFTIRNDGALKNFLIKTRRWVGTRLAR